MPRRAAASSLAIPSSLSLNLSSTHDYLMTSKKQVAAKDFLFASSSRSHHPRDRCEIQDRTPPLPSSHDSFERPSKMDQQYYNSDAENYNTIGQAPSAPWEILPIWLYLVSSPKTREQRSLFFIQQRNDKTDNNTPNRQPSNQPPMPCKPSSPLSPNAPSPLATHPAPGKNAAASQRANSA